ncbi:MAG: APC family permease [Pseudomonadota bacterium]
MATDSNAWQRWKHKILGAARDPFSPETRQHMALVAFLAWVGLGADGLSSSAYGPEEAFKALGHHTHLGLYLAVATALTVFIISLAYSQVIELFPSGGGGYRVATKLLGAHAGLVSGAALVVDYVLTIAISVASGIDALFSLLPGIFLHLKVEVEAVLILLLILLNLRGMKESIKVLLPIFMGFVLTHAFLIVYGIGLHAERLPALIPATLSETRLLSQEVSTLFVIALFLRAYSLGGGTYTGLEAVSNSVTMLAEPRIRTGKWTMMYMAVSLALTAGGIILLYLLWDARPASGQTLNAVTFRAIVGELPWGGDTLLTAALLLEGGLLFVAANTGFLAGPAVLANMALDSWVPHQFSQLSEQLVTKNGVLLMGAAALAILVGTAGKVDILVVLYSINVFLTFSLSLLGLCLYWWRNRDAEPAWARRFALAFLGLLVTAGILLVTVVEKFGEGGWVTVLITSGVVFIGLKIRKHYLAVREKLRSLDQVLDNPPLPEASPPPPLQPEAPTAVILVSNKFQGLGVHALLWVLRLFPNQYKNFVFVSVGEVDIATLRGADIRDFRDNLEANLQRYVDFCHQHGLAATAFSACGTDPVAALDRLCREIVEKRFPNSVFFAGKLVFAQDNWLTRLLHNHTAEALQRRLHLQGLQMIILAVKVS